MSIYPKFLGVFDLTGGQVSRGVTDPGETWELAPKETISGVHSRAVCAPPCPLHYPSEHRMDDCRLHWRGDRGIFERICEHGVGHPDPDNMQHIRQELGEREAEAQSIHGCDGCC